MSWGCVNMKNANRRVAGSLRSFFFNRKFKCNSLITVFVLIFLVIVFVFNVIISKVVDRYDLKLDLSFNSIYKISDQTKKFLKDYNKNARIVLLNDEDSLKKQGPGLHLYNIVKNIVACSNNISLEYVNLKEQPSFMSKYPDFNLMENGILILGDEGNARYIPIDKLFTVGSADVGVCSNVEGSIAHALEFLSGENVVKCCVLSGHDELEDLMAVEKIFGENGYELTSLNLVTKKIPQDLGLIFICAPKIDFNSDEVKMLEDFVGRGGRLIYFSNAMQPKLPNLESFFEKFGIIFEEGIVVETNVENMIQGIPNGIFVYADKSNRYTENMSDKKLPILFNDCRPIKLQEADDSISCVNICETSGSCSIYKDGEKLDLNNVNKASYPIAVGVSKSLGENNSAKITVFSSLYILDTIQIPQYGNGEFVLSVLGETANNNSKVKILPKSMEKPPLVINASTARLIGVVFMFILPVFVVFLGVVVYFKRKRR